MFSTSSKYSFSFNDLSGKEKPPYFLRSFRITTSVIKVDTGK